ncbi:hypothetical protein MXB_1182 [Myxobolus squamalis]|nr:hypothetical protein MXB_1182 [Myxobolus squamalis]
MAKRVKFSDDIVEHIIESEINNSESERHRSDNEDNEDAVIQRLGKKVLRLSDIEGQEAATETKYGDIVLTPFNLADECEEGHFDQSGNFIFDKTITS